MYLFSKCSLTPFQAFFKFHTVLVSPSVCVCVRNLSSSTVFACMLQTERERGERKSSI